MSNLKDLMNLDAERLATEYVRCMSAREIIDQALALGYRGADFDTAADVVEKYLTAKLLDGDYDNHYDIFEPYIDGDCDE